MSLTSIHHSIFLISTLVLSSASQAREGKKLQLLPFTAEKVVNVEKEEASSLNLRAISNPLLDQIKLNLYKQGLNQEITVVDESKAPSSDSMQAGFELNGYRICNMKVKAHILSNGKTTMIGDIPDVTEIDSFDLEFRNETLTEAYVKEHLASEGISEEIYLTQIEKCYWNDEDKQLIPVYKVFYETDTDRYNMVLDEYKVYDYTPREFHANATATVYETNVFDSNLKEFTIPNISAASGGYYYASNANFTTLMADGSARFKSTDTDFSPSVGSTNFDEVSLFTNAVRTLSWLESVGYEDFGSNRLTIVVHDSVSNNALYQPDNSNPLIKVGEGDGELLANLSTDEDVVSHELGHHVVYNSITRISGESLVLHEGLADFFTFARTGNACLGESICPATSDFCYVANQCLRTGDNDLALGAANLPSEPHLKSQFISGFLWDFIKKDKVPANVWAALILKSIKILNYNSGYQDLLLAMLVVDAAEYEGTYCNQIQSRATARGMGSMITSYTCEQIATDTGTSYASGAKINSILGKDEGNTESRSSSSSSGWCGAIAGGSSEATAVIFILPLLLSLLRRKED